MMASSTNRAAFKNRGGKQIIVHGTSDPIFSLIDIIDWWNELNKANSGNAASFTRLFAVPGMNHCSGGPALDQWDAFGALVKWVEQNSPPDSIISKGRPGTPWANRTRPLCPYPKYAHYSGSGNMEDASSFVCKE
jgi:feruloyl esterase